MTSMGGYVFDIEYPACDKFKPTLYDGHMCFELNLNRMVIRGKGYGLWLLMDPGTKILPTDYDSDGEAEEAGYVSKKEVIPTHYISYNINTLTRYSDSRAGMYVLSSLKRKTVTDDFLNLPDSTIGCKNESEDLCRFQTNNFSDCEERKLSRAQKLEEESLKECDCEPWFLGAISENTNLTLDQVEEEMSSQVPQLTQEGRRT